MKIPACQLLRPQENYRTALFLFLCVVLSLSHRLSAQDAEVLRQVTTISVVKGKLQKKHLWEIQINNRAGERFTQVSVPWSGLVKVANIEAMITDSEGTVIRKLDRNSISERSDISSISLYEDSYVKMFTLRHNRYPYLLTYSYEEEETQFIWIDTWVPVISPEIPTRSAELEVLVPEDYRIAFQSHAGEPAITEIPKKGTRYRWKSSYKKTIASKEVLSPPVLLSLPHVEIVPVDFFFEQHGSFESWEAFGDWQAELIGPPEVLPESEKKRIDNLIMGVDDTRERLRLLYHDLQDHTRYINVSIETGGLKPHPVSYVVNNRYGDCKALSNYFRSVLHYAGIRSLYSKIYAGDGFIEVDRDFPSQSFNHIILCVPIEGDTMWIDCTTDYPPGYIGTSIQGRDVFVVETNASHFRRTPHLDPGEVEEVRVFEVVSENPPSATVKIKMTLKGYKYELLRYISTSVPEKYVADIIAERFLPPGLTMMEYSIDTVHRDSSYIILNILAESNRMFALYGENIVITAPPFSLPLLDDPKTRVSPLRLEYPIKQTDSLVFRIPRGYKVINLPADTIIESAFASFSCTAITDGEKVSLKRGVTVFADTYTVDQYEKVYELFKKIKEAEKTTTIIAAKQKDQ